jgi:hypothetical protein
MPFVKGDSRINKTGRPAGALNRNTQQMQLTISRIVNNSLDNLRDDIEKIRKENPVKAAELALRLLEYTMPKLRSVDMRAEVNQKIQQITVNINGTDSKHNDIVSTPTEQ